MIFSQDIKLKKISDDSFYEIKNNSNEDNKFVWSRDLNNINLFLENIEVITTYVIHQTNMDWDIEEDSELFKMIEPSDIEQTYIKATLKETKIKDNLYWTLPTDKQNIYTVEKIEGKIDIELKIGKPMKENKLYPEGIYKSMAIQLESNEKEKSLCFVLQIPEIKMKDIINSIKDTTLDINILIPSFTYELDDYLRENDTGRDIIINMPTPCFVNTISIVKKT